MTRNTLLLLTVIAALVGCGGENPVTPDGGTTTDSGTSDGGTADGGTDAGSADGVCDDVRTIELAVGPNEITGNTTGRGNDVELGANCGNPEAARAPQEAVALTLPGTGQVGVRFSLATDGTATDFDTIVELRRDGCAVLAGAEGCEGWDDIDYPAETRSGGAFLATGGETVHVIVSGWDTDNAGAWQMDATVVAAPAAPTQEAVTVQRIAGDDGSRYEIGVTGGDADSDAEFILVTFLDSTGAEIGVDPDGEPATPDLTEIPFGFDAPVAGMATFTAQSTIAAAILEDFPQLLTATDVRVAVVDAFGLESEPMTVSVEELMESGRGEPCTTGYVCAVDFECTAGVCTIPAAIATYCAAATPIVITAGTTTSSATVTGTVATGAGMLAGTCAATQGNEVVYSVTVPALVAPVTGYDLLATTDTDATADGDTVLYAVGVCGDRETELACSDDIVDMTNLASSVAASALAAGTYTLVVEGYGMPTAAIPFGMDVSLRPVLATGTACDPAGVMNRCAAGACPAATMLCP